MDANAAPPGSTWRIAAYTRWEQLNDELCRVDEAKKAEPDYRIARNRLDEAKQAIEAPYASGRWKPLRSFPYFYSGARIEQTWSCLHEAERALLMLLDEHALRAQIRFIRDALRRHVGEDDPEFKDTDKELGELEGKKTALGDDFNRADRERLRAIRAWADSRSDTRQRNIRAFRNLILVITVPLGLLLVIIAGVHAADPDLVSVCTRDAAALEKDLCPNEGTKAGSFDIVQIELLGALGGLLAAIIPLRRARRLAGPYSIALLQATLKMFAGAAFALVGVLLLQKSDLLPGLARQRGSHVLAYAAFFGLAQQVLTRLVDQRAGELTKPTAEQATSNM